MTKYSVGVHTPHRLKYHLVWIPKYRKRVLRGPLARRLYELLAKCAEMNSWAIIELNVQSDHIHLLIQLPPKEAVAHAVQLMKGGSSRRIREQFLNWMNFFGATACGPMDISQNQWVRL